VEKESKKMVAAFICNAFDVSIISASNASNNGTVAIISLVEPGKLHGSLGSPKPSEEQQQQIDQKPL
jgi:hypothetical protein